jgi:type III restriction enzyme
MENYVVGGLVDFDDISYDANADLLYTLATQTVNHFKSYLPEEEVWQVLHHHQKEIARFIHGQMQKHYREEISGYEVKVSKGFTELRPSAFTVNYGQKNLDYRVSPADKSNMAKYLFGGFSKCLYAVQKFHSEAERVLAVILEREAIKWFKPAKGQFQIYYKNGADHPEYQPDFVVETETAILMLEPKSKKDLEDSIVVAKKDAAVRWCEHASDHNSKHGGKPWEYALIGHDKIAQNMTIDGLVSLKVR